MAKHIGIVACSAEGAALCYRAIAQEAEECMGDHNHPKVTLHSIPLAEWMPPFNSGDYKSVGRLMLESAKIVAGAGADFAICPDNSCHLSWEYFIHDSPIPWLHIAEVVAQEARSNGWKKAGLLGTRFTMSGPVYGETFARHHMEALPPSAEDQKLVDDVIFNELVHGVFPEKSRLRYNQVIDRLKQQGCDCVILGCTEIPLLVRADDCPLPALDSTRLLARAAVMHALAKTHTEARRHGERIGRSGHRVIGSSESHRVIRDNEPSSRNLASALITWIAITQLPNCSITNFFSVSPCLRGRCSLTFLPNKSR